MSVANSSPSRPASQPRDQLVLQIENVPLAGRLLTIEIFDLHNSAPTKATGTPSSPVRSAPPTPSTSSNSARSSGFRVAARDDVENEYSLFVTRQKAEYLYRAAYPAEAEATEVITLEAMANGILAYLNIIGNRQRDVGKLVCREPEPHVEKKIRVLPSSTPPHKQKNPHLPSKRQDQRAVRVQKTSKRTMEAVAAAMRRPGLDWNGDDECAGSEVESGKLDRKGSEASILHRMAVADSQTMWKAQLETNYEESDHSSQNESDALAITQDYTLAPGLLPVKRALPERKTKHKDLEERRQKGRHQRILIAQAAHEAPNSAQGSYAELIEETDQDSDPLSPESTRRTSMVSVSNMYGLKNLPESSTSEPEQFLRRRTLDTHRSVLGKENWQYDIPGMEIEITDERPTLETPPSKLDALLNSARRVMVANAVGVSLQRNSGTSKLIPERRRGRTSTSPNLYFALRTSHSAPRLQSLIRSDEAVKPDSLEEHTAGPRLKTAADSITINSPRSQTKSADVQNSDQPLSPVLSGISQKQRDDQSTSQEVPTLKLLDCSISEDNRGELRSRAPVPEFLAPPEPEKTTIEYEVIQEKEVFVASPDPEVVLYSPNELSLEENKDIAAHVSESVDKLSSADILSYQVAKEDVIQASENANLPPAGTNSVIDTEAQEHMPDLGQLISPQNPQHDVFPQVVMENPTQSGVEDKSHEQIRAREENFEAPPDTAMPLDEKRDDRKKESCAQVEMVIPDNQAQSYGNSPRFDAKDGEKVKGPTNNPLHANNDAYLDRGDVDQCGGEETPAGSSVALVCIAPDTVDAEISVDESETIKDGLNQIDDGAEVATENGSSSDYDADNNVKVMKRPVDYKDEDGVNMMTFPTLTAESTNSTLFSGDQNYHESCIESDVDSSVPDENVIQPAQYILPYEERTSVHPEAGEDTTPFEEDGREQHHDQTVAEYFCRRVEPDQTIPQKAPDNGVEQSGTTAFTLFDDNICMITSSTLYEESTRRSSVVTVAETQAVVEQLQLPPKLERRHTAEDVKNSGQPRRTRRTSTIDSNSPLPGLPSTNAVKTGSKVSAEKSPGPALRSNNKRQTLSKAQNSGVIQNVTNYHKKWGKWIAGKHIIEKVGCLQLEELVLADPRDEENLLKLGFRYARSPRQVSQQFYSWRMPLCCTSTQQERENTGYGLVQRTWISLCVTGTYDAADYRLMLMQCQQASGDYVLAAQSLASVLKDMNDQQDTTLKDEEYFDLWFSLAEKCFHHEDYTLASEYYAIALNFAKQSQALAAIHYNLGLCFQSLGEDNKCVTEYKRARTANRHVPPLVSLTELSTPYDERFAQLLQKSVVQTIEEVRVEFNSEAQVTKMPSLSKRKQSTVAARKLSVLVKIEDTSNATEVKKEESLPQKAVALDDNQASRHEDSTFEGVEHRHESFLARKQAAMEEMAGLLTNPQYRGREASPSSRSNARLKVTTQLRSGFLSPEKDRLDARRKQSMETFHQVSHYMYSLVAIVTLSYLMFCLFLQLGYISCTMPWIEFWEKLLALAPELFESRQALYGSIARIRGRQPLVTDEVAFCALAESIGNVHEAAEKLHDASYERELTYVCAVIEVTKLLERDFPLDPIQLSLKPPRVSLPTISPPTADSIAAHGSHSPLG
ncbi:Tetratricopeptide repeat [Phytophthora cactorum]|nr:Tetratricopeptide repeat [Phytophthora cactorum]